MATLNQIGVPLSGEGILKPYRYGESAEIYARRCALVSDYYATGLRDKNEYNRMMAKEPLHEYERLTWAAKEMQERAWRYNNAMKAVTE